MDKGPVSIQWFKGAETNIAYNCLDRHVKAGNGDKIAMYWEGNDLDTDSKITYSELLKMVCRIADYLKSIGIQLIYSSLAVVTQQKCKLAWRKPLETSFRFLCRPWTASGAGPSSLVMTRHSS